MGWAAGNRWYRQKITISGTNVAGDVTDFPVAINIPAGNDVFTTADTSGTDILFTADDGETFLDFERSVWDKSGSEGVFYVKDDLLSASDNEIYMYYGGSDLTDFEDAANVWDANFDAILHFEDGTYTGAANEMQDSSGNSNHARRGSGSFQGFDDVWGQGLNIAASNDWARFESNLDITTEYTISCLFWIPLSNSTSWHTLTRGSSYHQIILASDHRLGNYQGGFHASGYDMDSLSTGMHHVAVVRKSNGTGDFYVDGSFVGNASTQPQDDIYAIGNYQGNGQHYGKIDEFRVSAGYGRSANWLAVEAENLLNNLTFISDFAAREVSPFLITTSPHDYPTVVTIGEFEAIGGVRQILTEYTEGVSSTIYYDMPVYYALTDVVSGTRDVYNELYVATTGTWGDAYLSEYVELFLSSSGALGDDVRNIVDDFTVGGIPAGVYGGTDVEAEYIQGHIVSPSGTGEDVDVEWVMPAAFNTQIDDDVEFTISTSQLYEYDVDVYSSTYSGTVVFDSIGGWYDTDWIYRTKITVDYVLVEDNLTSFPLTVQINTSHGVFESAQNSGNDILFTNSSHVKLNHELSVFEKSNNLLVAYVQVDLSSSTDTDIYMYYGNVSAPDQSNATAVWTGYRGVYHFEDSNTSTLTDSTSNGRDGYAVAGVTAQADGVIGKSWEFRGNSGDYAIIPQAKGLAVVGGGARTVSTYMYPLEDQTANSVWSSVIRLSGDISANRSFLMTVNTNEYNYCNMCSASRPQQIAFHGYGGSSNVCTGYRLSNIGINDWHSYAVSYGDGVSNRIKMFLNGYTGCYRDVTLNTYDGDVRLATRGGGSDTFKFRFCELRVYNDSLSEAWLNTEHNNIIEMSSFLSFSDEELTYHWELDDYVDSEMATLNSGTGEGGYLWPFPADVYSSASGTWQPLDIDVYVSLCNTVPSGQVYKSPDVWPVASGFYFGGEITTSGALTGYEQDVYVSLESLVSGSNQNTYPADMRLHAMEIDNFFLEVDEYTTAAGVMSVDVYDKRRVPLSTSGTYFVVSGTQVPTALSGIEVPLTDLGQPIVASGYRMFFDSPMDFFADEPLEIVAHGENIIGDVIEQTYYLLYGYNLIYDTPPEVVWGWGDQIIVWATAKNKASCPAQSTDGWWFEIRPKEHADLGATIVPTGYANLPATIYPQLEPNTFFYGARVKVIVRAKDEAGNEMEPFVLNFTIEDNPN